MPIVGSFHYERARPFEVEIRIFNGVRLAWVVSRALLIRGCVEAVADEGIRIWPGGAEPGGGDRVYVELESAVACLFAVPAGELSKWLDETRSLVPYGMENHFFDIDRSVDPGRPGARPGAEFAQRFKATRRGARIARLLALHQLEQWGIPHGGACSEAAEVVIAELLAGRVPNGNGNGNGNGLAGAFELRMALGDLLRIEVGDAEDDGRDADPFGADAVPALGRAGGGYGLMLIDSVSVAWGVHQRGVAPGKSMWADLLVSAPA
ncbi:SsgA family sporulation/cell division regulator [Streptomyces sp. NBC_00536]|uniref:SsgA family sporulation/cell division regulator n=1 Tax=Streptomyces sp. NBC_00536 TaxID=2975769 RepID=UPI002E81D7A7|nr:SsgA family sporulation/cell division regulator [Streptomyces sp. NBC_00536]WUC77079.1 SsgA family sporulation/cell division regulator [Streptomyces sp. NBC_00536]